jgi:hypothetical protein
MRITVVLSATLLPILAWPALDATAQGSKSDEELIANAISAAPEAVAQDAAVVAVDAQGQMRTLREAATTSPACRTIRRTRRTTRSASTRTGWSG